MKFVRKGKVQSGPQKRLQNDVDRFGWHVVLVLEQNALPGWGYSVGFLEKFDHPEVIIFGLPKDLTHRTINSIGDEIKHGRKFEAGKEYPDILEAVQCMFQPVEQKWLPVLLGQATLFYDGHEFPVVQCIWPDKQQNYPWNADFRRDWLWAQPLLFHSDAQKANLVPLLQSMNIRCDQEHSN